MRRRGNKEGLEGEGRLSFIPVLYVIYMYILIRVVFYLFLFGFFFGFFILEGLRES